MGELSVKASLVLAPMLLALLLASAPVRGAELVFDPASTRVRIGLDSTLHRVEGTARLEQGAVGFDPAGGAASGRIVIDARSVETGNRLRDGQLHEKVLESARFPEIVFQPSELRVLEQGLREARVELLGALEIHGSRHAVVIPATVSIENGRLHVLAAFDVPHVAWGMRDMSNLLLSVDPVTRVEIDALATPSPAPEQLARRHGEDSR